MSFTAEDIIKDQRRIASLSEEVDRIDRQRVALLDDVRREKAQREQFEQERDEALKERDVARGELPHLRGKISGLEGRLNAYRQTTRPLATAIHDLALIASGLPKDEA